MWRQFHGSPVSGDGNHGIERVFTSAGKQDDDLVQISRKQLWTKIIK
jgi:hypothetical protein